MPPPKTLIGLPALGFAATRFYQAALARHFPSAAEFPVLLVDADFDRINACLPDNQAGLDPLLTGLIERLEMTGADLMLFPNITLHLAIDRLSLAPATRAKIVHPLEAGVGHLRKWGIDDITLAGTRHTMQAGPLAAYFTEREISVAFPGDDDVQALDRLRLAVYEYGPDDTLATEMADILSHYDNAVIACTELSVLNPGDEHIDLARLQIAQALASVRD